MQGSARPRTGPPDPGPKFSRDLRPPSGASGSVRARVGGCVRAGAWSLPVWTLDSRADGSSPEAASPGRRRGGFRAHPAPKQMFIMKTRDACQAEDPQGLSAGCGASPFSGLRRPIEKHDRPRLRRGTALSAGSARRGPGAGGRGTARGRGLYRTEGLYASSAPKGPQGTHGEPSVLSKGVPYPKSPSEKGREGPAPGLHGPCLPPK